MARIDIKKDKNNGKEKVVIKRERMVIQMIGLVLQFILEYVYYIL